MTTPTPESVKALADLADRVEAAQGPDRELDALIAAVHNRNLANTRFVNAQAWADEAIKERWNFPRYTASLDAAMTLKPIADDFVMDNFDGNRSGFRSSAGVFVGTVWIDCKGAATPALALTAAALRARAAHLGASHG